MEQATMGMPKYQCHEQVWAVEIQDIRGGIITPADGGCGEFKVPQGYVEKHNPQPGGYYVIYKGGYVSYSPAEAFKEGYAAPVDPVEAIARVAHEVNRAYCEALGDTSQPEWNDAPDWQRKSAMNGVKFHLSNLDARPDHSHNEWLREKEADGWKFGEVKDAEKKEHPRFVPYDELPVEQKAKDYLFRGVVRALAK